LTENDMMRLIGTRDGYAYALIALRNKIGMWERECGYIPARHVRRRQERDRILAPMRQLEIELRQSVEKMKAAVSSAAEH